MPKITQNIHIQISDSELIDILKRQYEFPSDSVLTFEINKSSEYDWKDVPVGWDRKECPTPAFHGTRIEIINKNGDFVIGTPDEWSISWIDGWIKKYRLLKGNQTPSISIEAG